MGEKVLVISLCNRYLWFVRPVFVTLKRVNVPVVFCMRQVPVVSSVFGSFDVSDSSAACSRTYSLRGGGQVGQTCLTHMITMSESVLL